MTFISKYLRLIAAIIISIAAALYILAGDTVINTSSNSGFNFFNTITALERSFYDIRMKPQLDFNTNCIVDDPNDFFFAATIKDLDLATRDCAPRDFEELQSFFLNYPTDEDFARRVSELAEKEASKKKKPKEEVLAKLMNKFKVKAKKFFDKTEELKENSPFTFTYNIRESIGDPLKKFISKDIVLLKIDDYSLEKINSWPIPRDMYADVINRLNHFGSKVLAFDILFSEEVASCNDISPDDGFAAAIDSFQNNNGRIVLAYSSDHANYNDRKFFNEVPGELFMNILESRQEDENVSIVPSKISKANWPIEKLLVPEPDLGFLNSEEDFDGVFRRYRVFANIDSLFFPSLGYRAYQSFTDANNMFHVTKGREVILEFEDKKEIKLNEKGETKIRWIGYERNFRTISLYDLISADLTDPKLKDLLKNKIVFFGSTAYGAHDLRNTPIDTIQPGVYTHMNFTEMMLQKFFYQPKDQSVSYSLAFLFSSMIILLLFMTFKRAALDLIVLLGIVGGLFYLDFIYFLPQGYELQLFLIYACLVSTYSFITLLNFNDANAEKKQIKGAFSRYVAPSIVDDMLDNPEKLKVGGEKKDITCLFSDVRDFTSISEKLTPAELSQCLNRYMGAMTDIVFETNGTLDKYIGDAIVAFWGAPIDIGDHVDQSMDAAVKMLEVLPSINKEFKEMGFPEFKIGLGLNSGECSVGNMGSDQIFAYTALGDNMNLGARLESLCKHYGTQILISEYTYAKLNHDKFTTRLIDQAVVKGKELPVGVYEVLYSYHPFMIDKLALKNFNQAYALYVEGKFEAAKEIFTEILSVHADDKSSQRLLESCNHWIETPPKEGENWAITTMTSK